MSTVGNSGINRVNDKIINLVLSSRYSAQLVGELLSKLNNNHNHETK